jgi:hypothetical protein
MATAKKTVKYGTKDIPLKKDGTPNLRNFTKGEKEVVKKYVDKKKKEKTEIKLRELEALLNAL